MEIRITREFSKIDRNGRSCAPSTGSTLTEIAIVLGIIGLILGTIWIAAGAVYNNLRVARANAEVLQMVQGVRYVYATQPNVGTTDLTDAMICAKVVPADIITTGCAGPGTLGDAFLGGITTIKPTTEAIGGLGFVITMTNIPLSFCANLIAVVAGPNRDPGLFVAQTAYTVATVGTPLAAAAKLGDPSTAGTALGPASGGVGGCTAASNSVSFGFVLK